MLGGFTDLFAVAACDAVVAEAEAVTIPLLRRAAIIDAGRLNGGQGVPPEAILGPLALYLADIAWTLQRLIQADERSLQPHRTHPPLPVRGAMPDCRTSTSC
jgi:hypothetical protein